MAFLARTTACSLIVALWAFGCSTSSSSSSGDASAAGNGGSAGQAAHSTGGTSSSTGGAGGSKATGGSATGGRSTGGGTSVGGSDAGKAMGGAGGALQVSPACKTYCECMAKNCADKVFPDGCTRDCATQTNWDLPCRQNMCSLVPAQPNNDHCTHAMGVYQCLNTP